MANLPDHYHAPRVAVVFFLIARALCCFSWFLTPPPSTPPPPRPPKKRKRGTTTPCRADFTQPKQTRGQVGSSPGMRLFGSSSLRFGLWMNPTGFRARSSRNWLRTTQFIGPPELNSQNRGSSKSWSPRIVDVLLIFPLIFQMGPNDIHFLILESLGG